MAHGTYFHIPSVASFTDSTTITERAHLYDLAICHGNPTKMLMNIINWPTRA